MEKLILKENYTREEADFMSLISVILKENPDTFQSASAYWGVFDVEVDFEARKLFCPIDKPLGIAYYTLLGASTGHHYEFVETFSR